MPGLRDAWTSAPSTARAGLIGGSVVILLIAIAAGYWALRSPHAVLFADLEPQDAAAVTAELERMKVEYSLAAQGRRILVPADSVHRVRLKLMGSGVPLAGGVGFEIFDNSEFGMTEFAQKINFQRALQGELTRTIMSLKEVKYARVHLVLPESGLFKRDETAPSASVTLFLKAGYQLGPEQIGGIQRLVAASVPGMSRSRVTVADQNGVTLSQAESEMDGVPGISSRLQRKQEVERYLTEKIHAVLERAFGPERALVSVDATLNFDQIRTTRENVVPVNGDPGAGMVRRRESKFGAESAGPGRRGNVTTEVEYQHGRQIEQIIETPGKIARLSIGVLVPPGVGKQEQARIRDLIAMTVGLDPSRGDAIAVHAADQGTEGASAQGAVLDSANGAGNHRFFSTAAHGVGLNLRIARALGTVPAPTVEPVGTNALEPVHPLARGRQFMEQRPVTAAIALVTILLAAAVLLSGMVRVRRRQAQKAQRMSELERQRTLTQLQDWLGGQPKPAAGNAGTS